MFPLTPEQMAIQQTWMAERVAKEAAEREKAQEAQRHAHEQKEDRVPSERRPMGTNE